MIDNYFKNMAKSFKCADIEQDCKWSTSANSISELMRKITTHVNYKHDIQKITIKLKIMIQASIKDY